MKKLVLAAAIAAAMPVLAQADVTIYGSLRVGVDSLKSSDTNFKNVTGVDDFGSRMGFKGSEDLGNGLKAIWQVESGLTMDGVSGTGTASGTLGTRMSFVGLEGSYGKIRLGYIDDVLSETEASDNLYGPRRDSMGIAFPLYEGSDLFGAYGDGRVKNSIRYDSPNWNGLSGILQYGAGEAQTNGRATGNTFGARLAYSNAGFFSNYAYMAKYNTADSNNSSTNRLEFGYDANNLYVAATYQFVSLYGDAYTSLSSVTSVLAAQGISDTGHNKLENHTWALNVGYTFGNFKPYIVYSKRGNAKVDGQTKDWGATQWAGAVDYTVTKRTMLEAGYGRVTQNAGAAQVLGWSDRTASITWLMMKHNF